MKNYPFIFIFVLSFVFGTAVFAQSSDAIAIRVIPNPHNYSAMRWYTEQKFSGSPQSTLVDGYEAVRDGRTVYVNAANIGTDNKLYTNIYLISYNQEAETVTEDIFGNILAHWKFNTNVSSNGQCNKTTTTYCSIDSDCPLSEYCLSDKAKIVRDTKRLGDLGDMETALDTYHKKHKYYPKLSAGSYLRNKTISTWPSWQKLLAQELSLNLPQDPINKLGSCGDPRFSPATCWDEKAKEFADTNATDPALNLPSSSNVFAYAATTDGSGYDLCAIMESGFVSASSGACSSAGGEIKITKSKINTAPEFTGFNLPLGQISQLYTGYISATDADGDVLSWSIDTSASTWTNWSAAPVLTTAGNVNQRKVYALKAGILGSYAFSVTINDNRGEPNSIVTNNFTINIGNQPPVILADNFTYRASTTVPLFYQATAQDDVVDYPLTYTMSPPLPNSLVQSFSLVSGNIYKYTLSGIFTPASNKPIYPYKDYNFTLKATDNNGAVGTKDFTIKVVNERPIIAMPLNCTEKIRAKYVYPTCTIKSSDPDGNLLIGFTYAGLPAGLTGNSNGQIAGTPTETGNFTVRINSTDEYGADSAIATYPLKVDSYCGDGITQKPNMEKKNGPDNDGVEECDDGNTVNNDACDNNCEWTCRGLTNILFPIGSGDAVVYDKNNSPNSAKNELDGTFLKLDVSMPTPYIWVANSNLDSISKIRTYDGCRKSKTGWDCSVWENRGQIIGNFPVGANPSRTAVNVETGDVWVANRNSANITKLDIDGSVKKTCTTGNGPRGVAIEESGDVWVANYSDSTVVKISGNDSDCTILKTVTVGDNPYGLAVDSNNNIWVSERGLVGLIQKIDTVSATVTGSWNTSPYLPYGITVDLDNNIWVADTDSGVFKLNTTTNILNRYSFVGMPQPTRTRGVTLDKKGGIWIAHDFSNTVIKIPDPNIPAAFSIFNSTGTFPIGIAGDSYGQVWAINFGYVSGTAVAGDMTIFDLNGAVVDPSIPHPVNLSSLANPYTYSDMTGLNRAMMFRAGNWDSGTSSVFDSGSIDQHWGKISWQEIISSAKQQINVYVRADNLNPENKPWLSADDWNKLTFLQRVGRFIEVKAELKSREKGVTPVLWDLKINCL